MSGEMKDVGGVVQDLEGICKTERRQTLVKAGKLCEEVSGYLMV